MSTPKIPQVAEPTPWHIGITLYPYRHFYGPTDEQGFSRAVGSCVTALGEEYDVANAALIVRCVNAHAGLVKALSEAKTALMCIRACSIVGAEQGYGRPELWGDNLFRSHGNVAAAIKTIDTALAAAGVKS